jgi:transposase
MKYRVCGLEEDRDRVATKNLLLVHLRDVPSSSVQGEGPPMTHATKRENPKVMKASARLEWMRPHFSSLLSFL